MKLQRYLVTVGTIATACFLSVKLTAIVLELGTEASPVWTPAGIALASLLLYGRRVWAGVALGMFLSDLTLGASLLVAGVAAASSTLGAIVGVVLLDRIRFQTSLRTLRDVLGFVALAVILSPAVNATLGTLNACLAGLQPWSEFGLHWGAIWSGDGIGILVVTPVLLTWLGKPYPGKPPLPSLGTLIRLWRRNTVGRQQIVEALLWLVSLLLTSWVVFCSDAQTQIAHYPLEYLTFPLIIWAALRLGQRGTVLGGLLVSTIAVWGATQQLGPFVAETAGNIREAVFLLQAFVGITVVTALVMAAAVAERQQAEDRLRKSEASLLNAQRIAQIGNWDLDLPCSLCEVEAFLHTLCWSDELYRILGFAPQAFSPSFEVFLQSVHPDDRDRLTQAVQQTLVERKPYRMDYRILLPDGSERSVSEQVEVGPERITGTVQDVTDQRQAESALRQSEEQFRGMFEGAAIGIGLDGLDGRILQSNPALQDMLGYSREELNRMTFADYTFPDDLDADQKQFQAMIAGQSDAYQMEKRLIRKDGEIIWVRLTNSLVRDGFGHPKFTIGMVEDITDLRQAEKSIQLYANIVKTMQMGLIVWYLPDLDDLTTFQLVDINPAARQILQVTPPPEEIIGKSMVDVFPSLLDTAFPKIYADVIRSGKVRDLGEIRYQDEIIPEGVYATKAFPLPDDCVGLMFEDITDRKRAEAALQQSEARFRVVAETAACAFLVYQGSHLRYVNPATEAITEYSQEELLRMHFWELAHPDFRETVQQRGLARQRGEAVPNRYEIKILTRTGQERWVDFTAGPIYLEGQPAALGTAYDITDRKLAEAHLRFAAERERLLAEIALKIRSSLNLEEILNTTVAEVRRFLQADRVFIAQINETGYSRTVAESVDPEWSSILGWTANPGAVQEIKALFDHNSTQRHPRANRTRIVNDTDQIEKTLFLTEYYRRCQVRAGMGVALMLNGEMFGVLIANQCSGPREWQPLEIDLFEQLATQVEIAIQQGQLYQQVQALAFNLESQVETRTAELQQRMQELHSSNQVKDLLLHAVSHDLRTPVQGMVMVLNKLRKRCSDTVPVSLPMLELMIQSCDHQLHLLNSLREDHCTESSRNLLNLAPIHLGTIAAAISEKLEPLLTQNQGTLINQLSPDLPPTKADAVQLEQIFHHLITNAVKHNPPGQTITLNAIVLQPEEFHTLHPNAQCSVPAAPMLYCTVEDTGVGMSQEQCDRVFQLYIRGVNNRHLTGIGLGLHYSRRVIRAHGGQIGVISCPGEGSKLWFTLPLA